MDTHYVRPRIEHKKSSLNKKKISKLLRIFLPVFVLAAMLPFFIAFVVSPPKVNFFTNADTPPELRVWLEPADIISSVGRETKLEVYAQFDSDSKLVPEISFDIRANGKVNISPLNMTYHTPFRGKVHIGTVSVTPKSVGESIISVPKDSISVVAYDGPLSVKTAVAKLTAR